MSWIHELERLPQKGDVVKQTKFIDQNIAKIIFENGKYLTIFYYKNIKIEKGKMNNVTRTNL